MNRPNHNVRSYLEQHQVEEQDEQEQDEQLEMEDGKGRRTGRNQHDVEFELQEADEMDLETIRDPNIAADGAEGENNGDRNKFVALVRHTVKADHFDRYRHASSWTVQSLTGKPGYTATYILHRLLPTTSKEDDDYDHGRKRNSIMNNLCARPLRHGETTHMTEEEGCYEICLLNKFENISSWQDHLSYESVIKWISYTIAVKDMPGMPQVFMCQKENGIHQEVTTGCRIGENLTALHATKEVSMMGDSNDNPTRQQQPRRLFVMMRKRTVVPSSGVNIDVLLQIMSRLSSVSLETEANKCLAYDIHTSRHVGPEEENLRVLEIGIWNTKEDYFNEHLSMPYVKQSEAISAAFEERNDEALSFWELLAPHGLLESEPDVSFMDDVNAAPSSTFKSTS